VRQFTCKYPNTQCDHCGGTIDIGAPITWQRSREEGAKNKRWHVDCYESARNAEIRDVAVASGINLNDRRLEADPNDEDLPRIEKTESPKEPSETSKPPKPEPPVSTSEKDVIALIDKLIDERMKAKSNPSPEPPSSSSSTKHKDYPELLASVRVGLNVWISGPAGSGKTTAAEQVAGELGLKFYFTGAIDQPYSLLGFLDANGRLQRTPFREAFEHGGVFLFDEIDGSAPAAILPFNAALANGACAFPDGIVQKHKDFRVIAAANTFGQGPTADYVGRFRQDAASLDRFPVQIHWTYDEKMETELSGNVPWALRVQDVRKKVHDRGLKVIVSPRATFAGAKLLATGMPQPKVEKLVLRKGMAPEQWEQVK